MMGFSSLGHVIRQPIRQLETFPAPDLVTEVVLETPEVTALCPVTGQPDWYTVRIAYLPDKLCLESKSLKLYLWAFRDEGHFCEALANRICQDVFDAVRPVQIEVKVTSTPRGSIAISSTALFVAGEEISQ